MPHSKVKILSIFTRHQVIPDLYEFLFFYVELKRKYFVLKNMDVNMNNQTVDVSIDFHSMEKNKNTMEVNGHQLFSLLLCSTEEVNLYRVEKLEGE